MGGVPTEEEEPAVRPSRRACLATRRAAAEPKWLAAKASALAGERVDPEADRILGAVSGVRSSPVQPQVRGSGSGPRGLHVGRAVFGAAGGKEQNGRGEATRADTLARHRSPSSSCAIFQSEGVSVTGASVKPSFHAPV